MVSAVSSASISVSIGEEIEAEIQKALELIEDVKKEAAKSTVNQVTALLIDYILANMKGDMTQAKAVEGQMSQVIQKYGNDMQTANALTNKLNAMDPSTNTASELAYLQSLIGTLQQDLRSGDLSNLSQFL